MEELKATMMSVRYRNPEHNWLVAKMKLDGSNQTFTATGDIPYSETEEPVQLYGEWVEDKAYGKQFKVTTSCRILPKDIAGLRNYLASSEDIKGVGPIRASKLADHFGINLFTILEQGNKESLSACPTISNELAERIIKGWQSDKSIRNLSILLARNGISPRWAGRILKKWDIGTATECITKNPYKLTEIEGIGFITADNIAMALGTKRDSPARIAAACVHVVSEAVQNGHVFLHMHQAVEAIVKLVAPRGKDTVKVEEAAMQAVTDAVANKRLIRQEISDGISLGVLLYLPHLYRAEKSLAESIVELHNYPHNTSRKLEEALKEAQDTQHVNFSTKQVSAIRGAFSNHIMVITGGPGTGKTTCVQSICQVAERLLYKIVLCAPTGRAAKRLSEVTGRPATTIHRLLKWGIDGPQHGRGCPIESDILIVDESSMLDLELSARLLEAVPSRSSIVFIGDTDQLPAISAGSTLRDIIASNSIPVHTLDTIFRQAEQSLIIRNSHLIRKGEMPRFPETKGVKEDSYVMWIPHNTNKEVAGKDDAEWVKSTLTKLVSTHIPAKYVGTNPIRDIQVLVPMKKNTIGTHELNKTLQQALNPDGEEFSLGGKLFRVGDRVMQTRNNYEEGMEVYNGDIGFVSEYKREDKTMYVDFGERNVVYDSDSADELIIAYAQTIHKSQGSEYPIVIVVAGYQHWAMLERNLLYTANTRAKTLCLYLASKGAIERAVKNNPVKARNTYLSQRIRDNMHKEAHA